MPHVNFKNGVLAVLCSCFYDACTNIHELFFLPQVWTGLRFLAGKWLWVNGADQLYSDLPLCPDMKHHCGALSKNDTGQIDPMDCTEKLNFLCYRRWWTHHWPPDLLCSRKRHVHVLFHFLQRMSNIIITIQKLKIRIFSVISLLLSGNFWHIF